MKMKISIAVILVLALCFVQAAAQITSLKPNGTMYASGSQLQLLWLIYPDLPQYVQMTLDHGNQISIDQYGKIWCIKPHQPLEFATITFSATVTTRYRFWRRGDSVSLFLVEYTPNRQVVQAYRLAGNTAETYATHSVKTLTGTHIIRWNMDNYLSVVVQTNLDNVIDLVRDFNGAVLGTTPATFFSLREL